MQERKGKEDRKDDQQTNKCNMPSSQPKRSRFKFRILSSSEHSYTEELVPSTTLFSSHPRLCPVSEGASQICIWIPLLTIQMMHTLVVPSAS